MRNCALLHRSGNVKMFQCDLSDRDNAITLLLNCADNLQIKILNFKLSLSSNLRVWFSFGPCNARRRHSARHRHRNYGIRHRFWFLKSPISTFPRLRNLAGILIRQKISKYFFEYLTWKSCIDLWKQKIWLNFENWFWKCFLSNDVVDPDLGTSTADAAMKRICFSSKTLLGYMFVFVFSMTMLLYSNFHIFFKKSESYVETNKLINKLCTFHNLFVF